eukprot:4170312-Pleurochrysis_carterae.AAC.1
MSLSTRMASSTVKPSGEINKKLHLLRVGQVVRKAPKRLVFSESGIACLTSAEPQVVSAGSCVLLVEQEGGTDRCEGNVWSGDQVVAEQPPDLPCCLVDQSTSGRDSDGGATLAEMMRLPRSKPIRTTFATDEDCQQAVRMREVTALMVVMPESMVCKMLCGSNDGDLPVGQMRLDMMAAMLT